MKRQPTPQHLTWFLDMYRNKQLELDPPYQRKSVWSLKDKKFFLDTIFRNYPAPPVFVHREIDDKGHTTFNIVDGKQRLETIMEFAENKISMSPTFGDENLNGKKFRDLTTEYKRKFWDYILVVDFIDSIEGTNIDEVFDRVNRNSKNLQRQELRHARFDGWFITEAESESEQSFWSDIKVSTKAKDKRMKNVQFISELLIIILENTITGFGQDYLDEMYAKYDVPEDSVENWDLDIYINSKINLKQSFIKINSLNQSIDRFGKTANNIYTLWALLALNPNETQDLETFAHKYLEFMQGVQTFIDAHSPEETVPTTDQSNQFIYYLNSKGAATEPPQRKARLSALSSIL